jgi:3-oxoacyl-[acyl-carrier protein] reductase
MKLEETKIIVTGAAQGLGRHFAYRLCEAGGQVVAGDVNAAGLESLAVECKGLRGKLHAQQLDVGSEPSIAEAVAFAHEAMGGLNALVNNAGILRDGLLVRKDAKTGDVRKLSREQWQAVIDVNLTGATLMARDVAAKMIETAAPGVIVNISSISRHGNRGQSSYAAAKAALAANSLTWARELAPYGIRVGAVAPGMVETPMTAGMNEKARAAIVSRIPVGRMALPEDIWLAVRFVIECDYFTSRCIDVDGGLSM